MLNGFYHGSGQMPESIVIIVKGFINVNVGLPPEKESEKPPDLDKHCFIGVCQALAYASWRA